MVLKYVTKNGMRYSASMCRSLLARANCYRKFVSTYPNRFVALYNVRFWG